MDQKASLAIVAIVASVASVAIGAIAMMVLVISNRYELEAQCTAVSEPEMVESVAFTLAQVAEHATAASCWSAINGNVYDLTAWIEKHPGGANRILSICGKDGSPAFSKKHLGEPKPEEMLASFKLGVLK